MYCIKKIEKIVDGTKINGSNNLYIKKYSISKEKFYPEVFYIPINFREDRHCYIIEAVQHGAVGFFISKNYEEYEKVIQECIKINPTIAIIQVENVNEALYSLAISYREQMIDKPIIAVTGSVGKTTTCEMIASILRQEKKVYSNTGNNNTKQLLAWLLLGMEEEEMAVLEAGMGNKNTMEPISKLLRPSICVINNIGTSHIEKLGSKENILEEKLALIKYMREEKVVYLNQEDELLQKVNLPSEYKVIWYGIKEAKNIIEKPGTVEFEIKIYDTITKIIMHTYGIHQVSNAIVAIRIAERYQISVESIQKGLAKYQNVDRRFHITENKKEQIIIDDTYNASFDSMKAGLLAANKIEANRRIAVLGEMLELGEYSKSLHQAVGKIFQEIEFDSIYAQGEEIQYLCKEAKKYMAEEKIHFYTKQEELIKELIQYAKPKDLIYIKASKKMNFDHIVKALIE